MTKKWSRRELESRWDGFWYVRDQDDPMWDTDSRINIAFTKFLDWLSAEEEEAVYVWEDAMYVWAAAINEEFRQIDEYKTKHHACDGCNLRDLTMRDAKEHVSKLLGLIGSMMWRHPSMATQYTNRIRREAAQWSREHLA